MNMMTTMATCGCGTRLDALEAEYGAMIADRIFEAEAADFLWESRIGERYLGQQSGIDLDGDDGDFAWSRIALLSRLGGHWHVGLCLVDGEGVPVELVWKRAFECDRDARALFVRAH